MIIFLECNAWHPQGVHIGQGAFISDEKNHNLWRDIHTWVGIVQNWPLTTAEGSKYSWRPKTHNSLPNMEPTTSNSQMKKRQMCHQIKFSKDDGKSRKHRKPRLHHEQHQEIPIQLISTHMRTKKFLSASFQGNRKQMHKRWR